jgi:hypothetical protein
MRRRKRLTSTGIALDGPLSTTSSPTCSTGHRSAASTSSSSRPGGSEYRVVKVMYELDELQSLLDAAGWRAALDGRRSFIFGSANPSR